MADTTYTPADFCQGHGGGRDCPFSPEYGCLSHGEDSDCGTVSYCDGGCPEGRQQFFDFMRFQRGTMPVVSDTVITLDVYGKGMSYQVSFEGPQAEDVALTYVAARPALHFAEVYDRPFNGYRFERLDVALHPVCHHGLSADLCMDPLGDGHFGTLAQERAGLL